MEDAREAYEQGTNHWNQLSEMIKTLDKDGQGGERHSKAQASALSRRMRMGVRCRSCGRQENNGTNIETIAQQLQAELQTQKYWLETAELLVRTCGVAIVRAQAELKKGNDPEGQETLLSRRRRQPQGAA